MEFILRIHPQFTKDISKIPLKDKDRIGVIIQEKLSMSPYGFGEPLHGSLAGFRKLRAGNYRIVFGIFDNTVYILGIDHRRSAYEKLLRRI